MRRQTKLDTLVVVLLGQRLRPVQRQIEMAAAVVQLTDGDREGVHASRSPRCVPALATHVELRASAGHVYAVTYAGGTSTLHVLDEARPALRAVLELPGVMHGPEASPDGTVWLAARQPRARAPLTAAAAR